jgi:hypothetical protein
MKLQDHRKYFNLDFKYLKKFVAEYSLVLESVALGMHLAFQSDTIAACHIKGSRLLNRSSKCPQYISFLKSRIENRILEKAEHLRMVQPRCLYSKNLLELTVGPCLLHRKILV